jgi:hypothetical protein
MATRWKLPGTAAMAPGEARGESNFYVGAALGIALVVAAGFGPRLDARLLHPSSPRPGILYVHAAMFAAWVVLFLIQAALVRCRRVRWHRRLGLGGLVLGASMPVMGVATALAMTRLHRAEGATDGEAFLIVSFFDMLAFALTFGLAAYWRRRPEFHRRLMLMASCGLTAAAFARFPAWLLPDHAFYLGVDGLILAAAARDWIVQRRVHAVYVYGLPALALGQATAMWIYLSRAPAWIAIARTLLR